MYFSLLYAQLSLLFDFTVPRNRPFHYKYRYSTLSDIEVSRCAGICQSVQVATNVNRSMIQDILFGIAARHRTTKTVRVDALLASLLWSRLRNRLVISPHLTLIEGTVVKWRWRPIEGYSIIS